MKGQPFVLTLWLHGNIHPLAEDFFVIVDFREKYT